VTPRLEVAGACASSDYPESTIEGEVASLTDEDCCARVIDMRVSTGARLAVTLVLFSALLHTARADPEDVRRHLIDPNTTAINGITIRMGEREILQLLGKPGSVESHHSELENKPIRTVRFDGMRNNFVDGQDYGLSCTGKDCRTDRGVKVGDVRSKVTGVYGPGNPPYEGSRRDTLSYPLRGLDVYLVFVFEKDHVVALEFFCDYS
jgi:hypothetical protein